MLCLLARRPPKAVTGLAVRREVVLSGRPRASKSNPPLVLKKVGVLGVGRVVSMAAAWPNLLNSTLPLATGSNFLPRAMGHLLISAAIPRWE
jgi:hypothetical protein